MAQNPIAPSNATLKAILETKDARITTLEKEVDLLEDELERIRECGGLGGGGMSHMSGLGGLSLGAQLTASYGRLSPFFDSSLDSTNFNLNLKRQVSVSCPASGFANTACPGGVALQHYFLLFFFQFD